MTTGNVGMDETEEFWPTYEEVLGLQSIWHLDFRPEIYAESNEDVLQYITQEYVLKCMMDAKAIAMAGYNQVFEDGPDVCDSESDSENSDHGEQWLAPDCYTPDMLDDKGKPILGRSQMMTD
jgi:hypothetical protein